MQLNFVNTGMKRSAHRTFLQFLFESFMFHGSGWKGRAPKIFKS